MACAKSKLIPSFRTLRASQKTIYAKDTKNGVGRKDHNLCVATQGQFRSVHLEANSLAKYSLLATA